MPTRTTRLAVLLVALGVAAAWAFGRTQQRRARTTLAQPVASATLRGDGLLGAAAAFRTLGASDKYDQAGRGVAPGGLVEPGLVPPCPPRQAELMVGEVPLAPGRGRLPEHPEEIGVGPVTAAEVGWRTP